MMSRENIEALVVDVKGQLQALRVEHGTVENPQVFMAPATFHALRQLETFWTAQRAENTAELGAFLWGAEIVLTTNVPAGTAVVKGMPKKRPRKYE